MSDLHQAVPCVQGEALGEIRATLRGVAQTVERVDSNQKDFLRVMEKIAAQGEHLQAVDARVTNVEKDADNLYERVRIIEMKPAEEGDKIKSSIWAAAIAGIVSTFVGFINIFTRG